MAEGKHERDKTDKPPQTSGATGNGLPAWLTVLVVLVLLGLLVWNIVFVGPEGLGTTYMLGGLLGAYAGIDHLLKRDKGDDR